MELVECGDMVRTNMVSTDKGNVTQLNPIGTMTWVTSSSFRDRDQPADCTGKAVMIEGEIRQPAVVVKSLEIKIKRVTVLKDIESSQLSVAGEVSNIPYDRVTQLGVKLDNLTFVYPCTAPPLSVPCPFKLITKFMGYVSQQPARWFCRGNRQRRKDPHTRKHQGGNNVDQP